MLLLLRRSSQAVATAVGGSSRKLAFAATTTMTMTAHCGFFGKSEEERKLEAEREAMTASLREKLGPLASLDLNGDGKIDAADAMLALEMAKNMTANPPEQADAALKAMGAQLSEIIATGVPSQVSWGFCSGYCAGFAAKKIGKVVAVVVGSIFCLLQALHYNGYIVVDHAKIEKDFNEAFDINKDGSIDTQGLQALYDQFYSVVSFNVPSGSGFAAGVLLGLRSG